MSSESNKSGSGMVLVIPALFSSDRTNGRSQRIDAWRNVLPTLELVHDTEVAVSDLLARNHRPDVCVDLVGADLPAIIRAWLRWRRLRPAIFLQDSQPRYFYSELRFRIAEPFGNVIVPLLNIVRGMFRQSMASLLFRSIGFVSRADAQWCLKSRVVTAMFPQISKIVSSTNTIYQINTVGVVANFEYRPNRDSMIRLLSDPYIDSLLQELDIKVILLGRGSLEFIFQLKPALQKHVDERRSGPFNELTEALSTVDITISPALFGAGVKNKVLEANNAEKLCLASRECAGEYGYDETLTIYFQDGRHLAQKINSLNVALKEFGSCSSAMLKLRGEIISLFRGI